MPVIFHLMNGTPIAIRGERLGIIKAIKYRCGIAFKAKSFESGDRFTVRPRATTHYQEITDTVASARRQAAEKRRHDEKDGKKPGPAMTIPGGK